MAKLMYREVEKWKESSAELDRVRHLAQLLLGYCKHKMPTCTHEKCFCGIQRICDGLNRGQG